MNSARVILIISFTVLICIGESTAAELYKWTDSNGVLTYSPTPPPESVTKSYEKVTLGNKLTAEDSQTDEKANTSVSPEPEPMQTILATDQNEDELPELVESEIREERQCLDLNRQIVALEIKLTNAKEPAEVNEAILLIGKYEQTIREKCGDSR